MLEQRKLGPNVFERLGTRWCRMMHDAPMWPMGGHYRCRACGRNFAVPWNGEWAGRAGAALDPAGTACRQARRLIQQRGASVGNKRDLPATACDREHLKQEERELRIEVRRLFSTYEESESIDSVRFRRPIN